LTDIAIAINGSAIRVKPSPENLNLNVLSKKQKLMNRDDMISATPFKKK